MGGCEALYLPPGMSMAWRVPLYLPRPSRMYRLGAAVFQPTQDEPCAAAQLAPAAHSASIAVDRRMALPLYTQGETPHSYTLSLRVCIVGLWVEFVFGGEWVGRCTTRSHLGQDCEVRDHTRTAAQLFVW